MRKLLLRGQLTTRLSLLCLAIGLLLSPSARAAEPTADDKPLSPAETARTMQLPDGFQCTVFAAEPDVVQPIGFTIDERGRLWVVESLTYPDWQPPTEPGQDRITILEDTNSDGQHDQKTNFYSGRNLTSVALGSDGAYVLALPELIYIPDHNHDDRPDGPPVVLLDGFSLKAKHNVANGLTWGPDGWLYGMHGILDTAYVAKPGTPKDDRTALNCSVWRYHPVHKTFEVVCHGTTNPWGLDYDQYGQFFITNCVIKHLFHVIPGGHFTRMYGQDLNPLAYELMPSVADYLHWGGGPWQSSRGGGGIHDAAGGGHAHAGCMIYQGDNWPDQYRHKLYTCNIHGRRVNSDHLAIHQSGYRAERDKDLFQVEDPWFRGLEMKSGPDGGVYLTDWNDTGECHDYTDTQVTTGRIYRITFGKPATNAINLEQSTDKELIELQTHKNDWFARTARRLLQARAHRKTVGDGSGLAKTSADLLNRKWRETQEPLHRLKFLWTLQATGLATAEHYRSAMNSDNPHLRRWGVKLAGELPAAERSKFAGDTFVQLATNDPSPIVRLELASTLQRLPLNERWAIAEQLLQHAEDAEDPNLPLLCWYGIAPLVEADRTRALKLIAVTKFAKVRQFLARRAVSVPAK